MSESGIISISIFSSHCTTFVVHLSLFLENWMFILFFQNLAMHLQVFLFPQDYYHIHNLSIFKSKITSTTILHNFSCALVCAFLHINKNIHRWVIKEPAQRPDRLLCPSVRWCSSDDNDTVLEFIVWLLVQIKKPGF